MRKGLSQILYLIIAASVLMMIAMVITFTATDPSSAKDYTEISDEAAITIAEDQTWKSCSIDNRFYSDVYLDCCETYVAGQNLTYRACEDVTLFRNDSTGGIEVRN